MEEVELRYYQEVETVDGEDFVITHILDGADKVIRKCRGCRVVKVSGKNPAQDYGSALTYARRYSLLLAFGLATADDDAATLNPVEQKAVSTNRKAMSKPKAMKSTDKAYRQAGVQAVKDLLDTGALKLADVQSEVRRYGAEKMLDLPPDAFVRCVATLTQVRVVSV
jgi:hypothetical protein